MPATASISYDFHMHLIAFRILSYYTVYIKINSWKKLIVVSCRLVSSEIQHFWHKNLRIFFSIYCIINMYLMSKLMVNQSAVVTPEKEGNKLKEREWESQVVSLSTTQLQFDQHFHWLSLYFTLNTQVL